MGLYDRDYYRQPSGGGGFGSFRAWSVTTWIIAINVAVFFLDAFSEHQLTYLGAFSISQAIWGLQLWRFITFQFLHAGVSHIFFNMLSLYFFGPIMEGYLGARKYIAFYLLCGIGGPLGFTAIHYLGFIPDGSLIGASAGIFGVLIGAATIAPEGRVSLLFPPVTLTLKQMAWIFIGIALYMIFTSGANAGGEAAHLGGAHRLAADQERSLAGFSAFPQAEDFVRRQESELSGLAK